MSNTYCVHARDEGRHRAHEVEAESIVDAAANFVERWMPEAVVEGREVSVVVQEVGSGERHCLTLDLDTGEAEACS